jgi:predicted DNA-binding transcriptional regulator AlpA
MATNDPGTMTNEEYMTTEQGAAYIGFTAEFLKARRQRGDGPRYIAIGTRAVRYRRADLDAWMATQFRTSTADDCVRRTG